MSNVCPICGGVGLVRVVAEDGRWVSRECQCQELEREERRLTAARIPERYRHCTLDTFDSGYRNADPSFREALLTSRKFADSYPVDTAGRGLLFIGDIGVGKTHLATGILQRLIRERGVRGLFCDYRELLKNIQHSYNPQIATTEMDLLRPVFSAEVLVLDDLGAQKLSEWASDIVSLILNTRYNEKLSTIITTNYRDLPAGAGFQADHEGRKPAKSEDTLGDRIGDRMRSRISEMCICVEMRGADFRQSVKRARFG
ncbi:ATP-binding protein [Terracidiphilus gabretensis]|jgi:DNA replication protein DnaC|uniref:ATP-binding protein n=1 Tax=Terracidiphilus gabretensis TaxID=1577687 RepID=UPI00071B2BEF|nr:ATP-binding protein [Terracidiphilus gabretensis]